MIKELSVHSDIFVWKTVADYIEDALKGCLKTDTLYFYYDRWPAKRYKNKAEMETIWLGDVYILEMIRLLIDETFEGYLISPYVTSAPSLDMVTDEDTLTEAIEKEIWGPEGRPEQNWDDLWEKLENGYSRMKPLPPEEREKFSELYRIQNERTNFYWLGDMGVNGRMECADEIVCWLWNNITEVLDKRRRSTALAKIDKKISILKKIGLFNKYHGDYEIFLKKWDAGEFSTRSKEEGFDADCSDNLPVWMGY